jgi:hypothetical protein
LLQLGPKLFFQDVSSGSGDWALRWAKRRCGKHDQRQSTKFSKNGPHIS